MSDAAHARRTIAIISHPDAGKTTLTEKLLLYGGAIREAGSVRAGKKLRQSTSDWMELERKRGISITSTVLRFLYDGYHVNLLDTPGHRDFSEDTYRVLTAADAAIVLIDSAKGVEAQTLKLLEVASDRGIPLFVFLNKWDRPARDPLDLIQEVESVLGRPCYPMTWPVGAGADFRGVYECAKNCVHVYRRSTSSGTIRTEESLYDPQHPELPGVIGRDALDELSSVLELLDVPGPEPDNGLAQSSPAVPVYFGSALNNFGVALLLDGVLQSMGAPTARLSKGRRVPIEHPTFSGFIFKIQANMDPRHRDTVAFLRVCSGRFHRDIKAVHAPTGRRVSLRNARHLFGKRRRPLEDAYAGDVVGIIGHPEFSVGDTLSEDPDIVYHEVPTFLPEVFAGIRNPNPWIAKRFERGLEQLLKEGAIQAIDLPGQPAHSRLLAAVGPLQFDVVHYRLLNEYNVGTVVESAPWAAMRWLDPCASSGAIASSNLVTIGADACGQPVLLFKSTYTLDRFLAEHPSTSGTQPFSSDLCLGNRTALPEFAWGARQSERDP